MHRQGEEVAGVPLLEDPQVVAALVSFATLGVELVREMLHRRERFAQKQTRRSSIVEVDLLHAHAEFPTQRFLRAEVTDLPVLIIRDFES
jgi:hypothetical protein